MLFLKDQAKEIIACLEEWANHDGPVGTPTGIDGLDIITSGWLRQDLIYLVGDSGKGKSWLASYFLLEAAKWTCHTSSKPLSKNPNDKPGLVLFWSLEMGEVPVISRLLAQQMVTHLDGDTDLLDARDIRENITAFSDIEIDQAFVKARDDFYGDLGEHIVLEFDTGSIEELAVLMANLSETYDILFVVVDYFRMISGSGSVDSIPAAQENRSKDLKRLAKHFDCAVLSIFDINREGQKDTGGPSIHHMRGGSAAQYDADQVLMLTWGEENALTRANYTPVTLRVAKNRNGPLGEVPLWINLANGEVVQHNADYNRQSARPMGPGMHARSSRGRLTR